LPRYIKQPGESLDYAILKAWKQAEDEAQRHMLDGTDPIAKLESLVFGQFDAVKNAFVLVATEIEEIRSHLPEQRSPEDANH
jgi:hypothetical protein